MSYARRCSAMELPLSRLRTVTLAALLLIGLATPSFADPVAFRFSGTLTTAPPANTTTNPLLLGLTAGTRFYGILGWDFNDPPIPDPGVGSYLEYALGRRSDAPTSFFSLYYTLAFDTFAITGSTVQRALIFNDVGGVDEFLLADRGVVRSTVPTVNALELQMHFRFTPDQFTSRDYPATLDPALFWPDSPVTSNSLWISWPFSRGDYDQFGRIETFEVTDVREPSTWALVGIGLGVLAVVCRKRPICERVARQISL